MITKKQHEEMNKVVHRMGMENKDVLFFPTYHLLTMTYSTEGTPPSFFGGVPEPNPETTSPRWMDEYRYAQGTL